MENSSKVNDQLSAEISEQALGTAVGGVTPTSSFHTARSPSRTISGISAIFRSPSRVTSVGSRVGETSQKKFKLGQSAKAEIGATAAGTVAAGAVGFGAGAAGKG